MVEKHLGMWCSIFQSEIVRAVKSALENAMQAIYFNCKNGVETAMFHIIEQALCEVARSHCDPRVTAAQMTFSLKPAWQAA